MTTPVDVKLYFNFRSPYCYFASKHLFDMLDRYHVNILWRPIGGWDGRSPPERIKYKIHAGRQDMARIARRMGIPFNPPPPETDPTRAGAGSFLAEEKGKLRPYIVEIYRREWEDGKNIGEVEEILAVGDAIGLDRSALAAAVDDPAHQARLADNWREAQEDHVFGVPSFVVGDQVFWGNDRIDFLEDHLRELRLRKI